jgi:hypothetical protein
LLPRLACWHHDFNSTIFRSTFLQCGVPFLFHTGQFRTDELLAKWAGIRKPADTKMLVAAVVGSGASPTR